jgi:hypothetical protein
MKQTKDRKKACFELRVIDPARLKELASSQKLSRRSIAEAFGITARRVFWSIQDNAWAIKTKKAKPVVYFTNRIIGKRSIATKLHRAWLYESKAVKKYDESKHWSNHPQVGKWRSMKAERNDPERHKKWALKRLKYRSKLLEGKRRRDAERRLKDPVFRIQNATRSRLSKILKRVGAMKPCRTEELLGCSWMEFKEYVESKFKRWMRWDNHGSAWHLDHVHPCASFDLTDERQVRMCFHFTNLQPIAAKANLRKGARITEPQLVMAM